MSTQLRLGVVGCGYWGPNLIRNFRSLPGCDLQAICDTRTQRLQHLRGLYPEVEGFTSFEPLLNGRNLDAVVVCTPVHHHFELARQSLEAGKHTLIEKPMASTAAQCEELVDLAKRKGLVLMVGHTFLYSPPVLKIKQIVDHGDIGRIRSISARRLNLGLFQTDINVTWDLAPHDLSIILFLLGQMPHTVNCQGVANVRPGIEDVTTLTLRFPGGEFATVHSSWLEPRKVRDMTIVGERRMIVYDDLEPQQKIKIYDARVETPPHYDTFAEFHYSYHYGDMYAPYIQQEEPLKKECAHFLDCIRNGTEPVTSGRDGLHLVQIMEAASESLRQCGAPVRLNGADA